jgi:hypothetical protein
VASKSAHQRALAASRRKAVEDGTLQAWYDERRAEQAQVAQERYPGLHSKWPSRDYTQRASANALHQKVTAPPPPANPFANYDSISTPEGMIWVEGERFPKWALQVNSDRRSGGSPRNP